jgi:SAM-dependent methyltransferase
MSSGPSSYYAAQPGNDEDEVASGEVMNMASVTTPLRAAARAFLYAPAVKTALLNIPGVRKIYPVVERRHPIDAMYGINTSGHIKVYRTIADKRLAAQINNYAGSQPSIVRTGLKALGDVHDRTFIDLGCGKGRVTVIAAELPFRDVVGIELSNSLVEIARANAAKVSARFPKRAPVTIHEANAVTFPLPKGELVFFCYHPFNLELMAQMVTKLEVALEGETPRLFFIYYNPVHGETFDASPAFTRYYAQQIPYHESELGYGPDLDDTIVIWQSVKNALPTPHSRVNRKIVITKPLMQAELEK